MPSLAPLEVAVAVDLEDPDVRGKRKEVKPSVSDFNAQLETGPRLASARNSIAALESAERKRAVVIAATSIVCTGIERTHKLLMCPESGLKNTLKTWRKQGILEMGTNSVCWDGDKLRSDCAKWYEPCADLKRANIPIIQQPKKFHPPSCSPRSLPTSYLGNRSPTLTQLNTSPTTVKETCPWNISKWPKDYC